MWGMQLHSHCRVSNIYLNHEIDSHQFLWNWTSFIGVLFILALFTACKHTTQYTAWSAIVALERTLFGRFRYFPCVCDFKSLISLLWSETPVSSGSAAATQRFTSGQTSDHWRRATSSLLAFHIELCKIGWLSSDQLWNRLPEQVVSAGSVRAFISRLNSIHVSFLMYYVNLNIFTRF